MLTQLFIFTAAIFMVVRGSVMATKHAALLATRLNLSKYTVGLIIISVISILPETIISIQSALKDDPSFGFGMLLGSNVADLTLIIALLILFSRRPLHVEGHILKNHVIYPFILLLPIIFGLDGHLSRIEGASLIIFGLIFYSIALYDGRHESNEPPHRHSHLIRTFFLLLLNMTILLVGAHFVVTSATTLATMWGISSILIAMLVVALGTTMPEFFFSLHALKSRDDSLAVGDILGTVLADATIVVGLLALISPFTFPTAIIYAAGIFMVSAALILFIFMRSGRVVTGKEALVLFIFWLTFILVQFVANTPFFTG